VVGLVERACFLVWDEAARAAPTALFEPPQTLSEVATHVAPARILILKLDHLGDFILAIPALERLRADFPTAEITLVVGSWNADIAGSLRAADRILVFDAFPRNSAEEAVDVPGKTALFDALVTGHYDLAIDLRTDHDTRFLLRNVDARIKAGIGLKAQHPFLDIFLPLDPRGDHFDVAWRQDVQLDRFSTQSALARSRFSISGGENSRCPDGEALVWGPYLPLPPGDYVFEPFVETEGPGLIAADVALDTKRVAYLVYPAAETTELRFRIDRDGAQVEFRLWPVAEAPLASFRFYGGRLSKRGTSSAMHQSESLILLANLVSLRLSRTGRLEDVLR
jgi:hypothetical protein